MPPILHIMRHGQGFHSADVTKDGHLIRDPHLTDKGKEQCRQACEAFSRHDNIDLLLASPLRRTIQTASIAMSPCLARGLRIVAIPHAEEVSTAPSDTGSPVAVLREEFAVDVVDLAHLQGEWFRHEGEFAADAQAVNERARKLRRWIRDQGSAGVREVALVSHGFFNHYLTGDVDDAGMQTTPWWKEAELRTYTFGDDDDEQAMIYETESSLIARDGMLEDGSNRFLKLNQPADRGKETVSNSSAQ